MRTKSLRPHGIARARVLGLVVAMAVPLCASAQTTRALVRGVPYIGWHETALTAYDRKTELNPSIVASQRMLAAYWRPAATAPAALDAVWKDAGAVRQSATSLTIDSLKSLIRAGIPVYVDMTLTAVAHPLAPELAAKLAAKKLVVPNAAITSGLLGTMIPVAEFGKWTTALESDPGRNVQMMAARVVIGFDDARKVFILHDPSFGPAWETPFDAFETAWRAAGGQAAFLAMPEAATLLASHAKDSPYRGRSSDERAAERYAMTYAAAATGQFDNAERTAREALKMLEASDGYRHMLNLELGLMLRNQNRAPEAIAALEESLKWVNDSPLGWQVLSQLYKRSASPDARLTDYATRMASDLSKDPGAAQRLAALLPADMLLVPFLDLRGWCGN